MTKLKNWAAGVTLVGVAMLMQESSGLAFGSKPEHSSVEATAESAANDALTLTFKVLPKTGMKINLEGPWKLELTDAADLALAKTTLVKEDLKETLTGFVVTTTGKPAKAEGTVNYKLTSFICTVDKTQCYREVHSGALPWKLAAKKT